MEFAQPIKGIGKSPKFVVTQWFAEKKLDYSQFGLKGHNGIDFACPRGTPIHALADGYVVETTNKETGYGLRVTQWFKDGDNEYLAVYGHCKSTAFPDVPYNYHLRTYPIKKDQIIAWVNNTGFSTGDHLHLGLYPYLPNGQKKEPTNGYGGAIDPKPYIVWDNSEPEEPTMVKRVRVNGTEYLEFNETFSIGIASKEFADLLTSAYLPIEDANSVAEQKFTLTSDAFVIHRK